MFCFQTTCGVTQIRVFQRWIKFKLSYNSRLTCRSKFQLAPLMAWCEITESIDNIRPISVKLIVILLNWCKLICCFFLLLFHIIFVVGFYIWWDDLEIVMWIRCLNFAIQSWNVDNIKIGKVSKSTWLSNFFSRWLCEQFSLVTMPLQYCFFFQNIFYQRIRKELFWGLLWDNYLELKWKWF